MVVTRTGTGSGAVGGFKEPPSPSVETAATKRVQAKAKPGAASKRASRDKAKPRDAGKQHINGKQETKTRTHKGSATDMKSVSAKSVSTTGRPIPARTSRKTARTKPELVKQTKGQKTLGSITQISTPKIIGPATSATPSSTRNKAERPVVKTRRPQAKTPRLAKGPTAGAKAKQAAIDSSTLSARDGRGASRAHIGQGLRPAEPHVGPVTAAVRDGRISKSWPTGIYRTSARGMHNAGHYCYRNSSFQALLHCPEFVNFLNAYPERCRAGPADCLLCSIRRVSFAYWEKGRFFHAKLNALNDSINHKFMLPSDRYTEWNNVHRQQDAEEFISLFVQHLVEPDESGTERHARADALRRELFDMTVHLRLTCQVCGQLTRESQNSLYTHIMPQDFEQATAQVDAVLYLSDCLAGYFNMTVLGRSCVDIECPTTSHTITTRIITSSAILIIHLPTEVPAVTGMTKCMSSCKYEEQLDLSPYLMIKGSLRYTLRAVVAHQGPSLAHGHYLSVIIEPNSSYSTVSDRVVYRCMDNETGKARLMAPRNIMDGAQVQPFVLVYTKDDEAVEVS